MSHTRRRVDGQATGRHPGGRPSKLTPEVEERLIAILRAGNFRSVAAVAAGISAPTFYRAMKDPRPRFRQFREAVERAEAQAEAAIVANIVAASRRRPDVALKFLAIRWPERWAPNRQTEAEEREAPRVSATSSATATVVIPPDRIPEFARALITARVAQPQLTDGQASGDVHTSPPESDPPR